MRRLCIVATLLALTGCPATDPEGSDDDATADDDAATDDDATADDDSTPSDDDSTEAPDDEVVEGESGPKKGALPGNDRPAKDAGNPPSGAGTGRKSAPGDVVPRTAEEVIAEHGGSAKAPPSDLPGVRHEGPKTEFTYDPGIIWGDLRVRLSAEGDFDPQGMVLRSGEQEVDPAWKGDLLVVVELAGDPTWVHSAPDPRFALTISDGGVTPDAAVAGEGMVGVALPSWLFYGDATSLVEASVEVWALPDSTPRDSVFEVDAVPLLTADGTLLGSVDGETLYFLYLDAEEE